MCVLKSRARVWIMLHRVVLCDDVKSEKRKRTKKTLLTRALHKKNYHHIWIEQMIQLQSNYQTLLDTAKTGQTEYFALNPISQFRLKEMQKKEFRRGIRLSCLVCKLYIH